jgi:hypothetical protein
MKAPRILREAQPSSLFFRNPEAIRRPARSIAGAWQVVARFALAALVALPMLVTQNEALADSRLPYGPNTCKNGFVFREAYKNDQVCVSTEVRAQVARDNAAAVSRIQPGGGRSGPNTCKEGFVWRLTRPQDLVCVDPSQRTQAADDNRNAYSRQQARLTEPRPVPPKPRAPVVAVDADGKALPPGPSGEAQCKLGGARCPPRMAVAYDDDVGCICRE